MTRAQRPGPGLFREAREAVRPHKPGPGTSVIGVGASSRASVREVGDLIDLVLAEAGLAACEVCCVATADGRAAEALLRAVARFRGLPLITYPVAALAEVEVPHPSDVVRARTGSAGIAEAAALHAARLRGSGEPRLVVQKHRSARATAAVATATVTRMIPQRPAKEG